ncbi:MAG: hypothetical protein ACLQPH_20250 [Acidimicrobiales bacterium]
MRSKVLRGCSALVVAIGLATVVQIATFGSASATPKPKTFEITKVTPNPTDLVVTTIPGSARKTIKVKWKGTAVFPIKVNTIPAPGCGTATFTCNPSSVTVASGGHTLKLVNAAGCTINAGSSPGSAGGTIYFQLVDAHGRTTAEFPTTYLCTWS